MIRGTRLPYCAVAQNALTPESQGELRSAFAFGQLPSGPAPGIPLSRNPRILTGTSSSSSPTASTHDNSTETHRGRWREMFPGSPAFKPKELHVEIGCNAGHVVLEWAARNPENAYVGIDWKFKPIFWGIEKAVKRTVANLLFFRAHAERLPFMFGTGEIDFLYLFFPDPWPKKKQWKNRFLTAQALARLAPSVRKGRDLSYQDGSPGIFRVDARSSRTVRAGNRKTLGSRGTNARSA